MPHELLQTGCCAAIVFPSFGHVGIFGGSVDRIVACGGVELAFTPRADAGKDILVAVDRLTPAGSTPLTRAVRHAVRVLGRDGGDVVLVTDGKETCGGDPCALAARIAATSHVTVHVIGFRIEPEHFDWGTGTQETRTEARCLAERTGGLSVSTETVDELADALTAALGCPVVGRREISPVSGRLHG